MKSWFFLILFLCTSLVFNCMTSEKKKRRPFDFENAECIGGCLGTLYYTFPKDNAIDTGTVKEAVGNEN
jgi:preprotein translocase subunit SecG